MNHVEIIGLAGAGKTTLKTRLVDRDTIIDNDTALITAVRHSVPFPFVMSNIIPISMCEFYWDNVLYKQYKNYFQKKYPMTSEVFEKVGKVDERESFPERYYQISSEFVAIRNTFSEKFDHSKKLNDNTVVFDEGLIQYLSTMFRLGGETTIDKYLNQVPRPDIVINIDCSSEVAFNRQIRRNKGRASSLLSLDRQNAIDSLERTRNHFCSICNQLESENVTTITVDSERYSSEECAEIIKNHNDWVSE